MAFLLYLRAMDDTRHEGFWKKFPGLVWSNAKAGDTVMIRAALTRPQAKRLETIGREFGLARLQREWKVLCSDNITPLSSRHIALVSHLLVQVETSLKNASGTNREVVAGTLVKV